MMFLTKTTVLSVFIFLSATYFLKSQNIVVLNIEDNTPIPNVAIFNNDKSKSVITDIEGKASLSFFDNTEIITFKHLGYSEKSLKKSTLKNTKVYLISNTEGLDEIILSASNFKERKREIVRKIVRVTAKDISFNNPQTSADVLQSTGQVFVQKSQLGGGSPIIRGFSTNRLLITVDGVRMNNAIFRGGNLQNIISIDPYTINNTEINLGAGTMIYGSDAIGGVMSFYTKKPQVSAVDSTLVIGKAALRYATANKEKTAHADITIGLKKWGFTSSLSYSSFDDLRMGKYGLENYVRPEFVVTSNGRDTIVKNQNPLIQKFTGYNQINAMQKVLFVPKNDLEFNLGVFYTTTSDIPRYDRLIEYKNDSLKSAEWYYGPQRWLMGNLQASHKQDKGLYNTIKITTAYQNFEESRNDRKFGKEVIRTRKELVDAFSLNTDFENNINTKTTLFYGFEYIFNEIRSLGVATTLLKNTPTNVVTRYPNGSNWQSGAVYTNVKRRFSKKLTLTTGARYNIIHAKADFNENNVFLNLPFSKTENTFSALTGAIGTRWLPHKMVDIKFNVSSAFRAPNIDDIGKVFDSEPGTVVVPNQNLKPEYAYSSEFGLGLNALDIVRIETAVYYTYLDNALMRKNVTLDGKNQIMYDGQLSQVQSIQNAALSRIYGFELGARAILTKHLKLTSQYSFTDGKNESDGVITNVRHVTPGFGNTHLIWDTKTLKIDGYVTFNNALHYSRLAPSEIGKAYLYAKDENGNPYTPNWRTLNLTIQYKLQHNSNITASLENITDKRYRVYSSGITAPGRNLIVALNLEF